MLLECPKCQAKYNIADTAIPESGRNVRCAACGHFWRQLPENAAPLATTSNQDNSEERMQFSADDTKDGAKTGRFGRKSQAKTDEPPREAHKMVRDNIFSRAKFLYYGSIFSAWFLAVAIIVGVILYGVANREDIVKKWPNSASFFALLGARANTYGMEITKVQVKAGQDAQGERLVIAGLIKSTSHVAKPVPYIRITLVDKHNKQVASWLADPGITIITPMAQQPFESIKRPIPKGDLRAIVTFNDPPKDLPNGQAIASQNKEKLMGSQEQIPQITQNSVTPISTSPEKDISVKLEGQPSSGTSGNSHDNHNGAKTSATKSENK